ncbi:hypothetical protein BDV18DRAFT_39595 [Aspergillus unguis]
MLYKLVILTALLVPVLADITRDVCILGGGATGTYAAVQLLERGQSVIVVEQKSALGGHSDTFYTPDGEPINYGILSYFDEKVVRDFLALLGVEHELYTSAIQTDYVNFKTGQRVSSTTDPAGLVGALTRYRLALQQFSYLERGRYNLPEEIPEVLLRPFSEFVDMHDLHDLLPIVYIYAYPIGDVLASPLLYIIQLFGISHINAWLHGPFIRPKNGTDALFRAAARRIGDDNVLYESTVTQTTRDSSGVELVVQTADGVQHIHAKQLLITFPPLLSSLHGFDLDIAESSLFEKWIHGSLYVAVVNNSGLPDGHNIINTDPSQPDSLPVAPFEWALFSPGVAGYYTTATVGNENMSEQDANALVLDNIRRMGEAGTFDVNDPEIVASESHSPSVMMAPVEDIRGGFYSRLYALQGQRSTYWTGNTFCTDYSPQLWEYTLDVLDLMFLI